MFAEIQTHVALRNRCAFTAASTSSTKPRQYALALTQSLFLTAELMHTFSGMLIWDFAAVTAILGSYENLHICVMFCHEEK